MLNIDPIHDVEFYQGFNSKQQMLILVLCCLRCDVSAGKSCTDCDICSVCRHSILVHGSIEYSRCKGIAFLFMARERKRYSGFSLPGNYPSSLWCCVVATAKGAFDIVLVRKRLVCYKNRLVYKRSIRGIHDIDQVEWS